MDLKEFVNSNERSAWIREKHISVYVRKSKRLYIGYLIDCLDLASIQVDVNKRNRGVFTKFLKKILRSYPNTNIFVESIHNPILIYILKNFSFVFTDLNQTKYIEDADNNMILIRGQRK